MDFGTANFKGVV